MIVIPGGLTPYLEAGDIGIYRSLKDLISEHINAWKQSDSVEYTKGGNPKPPSQQIVNSWVGESWRSVKEDTFKNSIAAAGFSTNHTDWHISKHDVYGQKFLTAWNTSQQLDSVEPPEI